jgi:hypothetical protein
MSSLCYSKQVFNKISLIKNKTSIERPDLNFSKKIKIDAKSSKIDFFFIIFFGFRTKGIYLLKYLIKNLLI